MLARTMGAKISALRNSASARSWMDVLSEQGKANDGAAIWWQLASDGDAFGSSPGMLLLLALLAFVIGSAKASARSTGAGMGDRERGDATTDRLD